MEIENLKKEIALVKAEGAYKKVMLLSSLCVVASIVFSVLMYLKTEKKIKDISSKVVVIDNGTVITGDVQEVNETELAKLKCENVLRIGVDYLYSFSAANYDERINLGRAFFGKSGDEILQGYLNGQVKDKIVQNNLRVDLVVKKLEVTTNGSAITGEIQFEQSFVNGTAIQKRTMIATCSFEASQVSSKNAFGIIIDNWMIKTVAN